MHIEKHIVDNKFPRKSSSCFTSPVHGLQVHGLQFQSMVYKSMVYKSSHTGKLIDLFHNPRAFSPQCRCSRDFTRIILAFEQCRHLKGPRASI